MPKYSFTVARPTEVDFNRIAREAPPEANALLVSGANSFVLMLRQDWVSMFRFEDIRVRDEELQASWGYIGAFAAFGQSRLQVYATSDLLFQVHGWRFRDVPPDRVDYVIGEVQAALAYTPKHGITVLVIG